VQKSPGGNLGPLSRQANDELQQIFDDRPRMMQGWADYLDGMAFGAKVQPLRKIAA
jgi:hypothetical protein